VFVLVVFTFFFVDFFDTAGTLIGVSQIAGFLDENGDHSECDDHGIEATAQVPGSVGS
jgi:AGZA family xanthine/uracil permease-like MFS transporter